MDVATEKGIYRQPFANASLPESLPSRRETVGRDALGR